MVVFVFEGQGVEVRQREYDLGVGVGRDQLEGLRDRIAELHPGFPSLLQLHGRGRGSYSANLIKHLCGQRVPRRLRCPSSEDNQAHDLMRRSDV